MLAIIGLLLLTALAAYLWGSIPTGYWMGKLLRGKDFDIRTYGSHKIGMTNVLRTLGKGPAVVVLIVDLSKGIGPTLLATVIPLLHDTAGWAPTVAGIAALLGHCFPVFIGFRGGRGVLTGGGALLVISPLAFLITIIVGVSTIAISRYVSLGSIVGGVTSFTCGLLFFLLHWVTFAQATFMMLAPTIVILIHYDNIGRLLAGKERKIGQAA